MKLFTLSIISTLLLMISCEATLNLNDGGLASSNALSGSYTNLLVVGDFMYAVNIQNLSTFDVSDADEPVLIDDQEIGFNIESLLHHKGNLFIGSPEAMHIFSIAEDGIPSRASFTDYGSMDEDFCRQDPIAVNDNYAYASLSSVVRTDCFRTDLNELRIYDITNLTSPQFENSIQMDSPRGIALDGNTLFVAEANVGLKVFNIEDAINPEMIYHFDGFQAFDLIPDNGLLIVVGPQKIYEYDYSDISNMTFLSELDI